MQTAATNQKGKANPPIWFKNAPINGPANIPIPIPPSRIPMYYSLSSGKNVVIIAIAQVEFKPPPMPPIV